MRRRNYGATSHTRRNNEQAIQAIRFPAPGERPGGKRRLPRLRDLFARRWRRVVIQGQHYWLPG
ncbi:MAG: hypothetical protein P8129_06015 [Anaerolineae bacterium]